MSRRRTLLMGLALAAVALPVTAQTQSNPNSWLDDRGPQPINEIYGSSSTDADWSQDRLGVNTLPAGQSFMVVQPAGRRANGVRVIWADGANQERRQGNTSTIVDLNFHCGPRPSAAEPCPMGRRMAALPFTTRKLSL